MNRAVQHACETRQPDEPVDLRSAIYKLGEALLPPWHMACLFPLDFTFFFAHAERADRIIADRGCELCVWKVAMKTAQTAGLLLGYSLLLALISTTFVPSSTYAESYVAGQFGVTFPQSLSNGKVTQDGIGGLGPSMDPVRGRQVQPSPHELLLKP
jgi:hypothetical protein